MAPSITKRDQFVFEAIQKRMAQLRLPFQGDLSSKEWTDIAKHLNYCGLPLKSNRSYCTGKGVRNFYSRYLQNCRAKVEDRSKCAPDTAPHNRVSELTKANKTHLREAHCTVSILIFNNTSQERAVVQLDLPKSDWQAFLTAVKAIAGDKMTRFPSTQGTLV